MKISPIHFSVLILFLSLSAMPNSKANISKLKSYLNLRDRVPKVYIPEKIIVGSPLEILVAAPGAKEIVLLGSESGSGIEKYPQLDLRLGKDFKQLASKTLEDGKSKVSFVVNFDEEQAKNLENKDYFFEALIVYSSDDGQADSLERAVTFGSNANFTGNNAVRISPAPKDNSGVANMAKNFLPGLNNLQGY